VFMPFKVLVNVYEELVPKNRIYGESSTQFRVQSKQNWEDFIQSIITHDFAKGMAYENRQDQNRT
jgi:hypothetical protein